MITGIIKVEVSVISRNRRLRLITLTETLIIPDITKPNLIIVLLYIVLKKTTTNALLKKRIDETCFSFAVYETPLTKTTLGNHALRAQPTDYALIC